MAVGAPPGEHLEAGTMVDLEPLGGGELEGGGRGAGGDPTAAAKVAAGGDEGEQDPIIHQATIGAENGGPL